MKLRIRGLEGPAEEVALECLYWFFRMVATGGPDGSDLDAAVYDDARAAAEWYEGMVADEGGRKPEYDKPKYSATGEQP